MQIKVIYKSEKKIDPEVDHLIRVAMVDDAGFKWYAEGYNFITGERDICFDTE